MVRDARRCRAPHHEGLATCSTLILRSRACAASRRMGRDKNADTSSHSRGMVCPSCCNLVVPLLEERAQGKPGADRTRSLASETKVGHERSHYRFSRNDPTFPAQWCYGFLRALPGEAAFLATVAIRDLPDSLTPGSRRQDHTTSPSAVNVRPTSQS